VRQRFEREQALTMDFGQHLMFFHFAQLLHQGVLLQYLSNSD
jgi:hypothetical protein